MFGSFCNMIAGAVVCSSLQLNPPPEPQYVLGPEGQVYEVDQPYQMLEGCVSSQTLNSIDQFNVCF